MSIKDALQKEFQIKRNEAQVAADINMKNAMNIEDFKNTFNNIRAIQFEIAKCEFLQNDTTPLIEKLKSEKEKLKDVLEKNNIDSFSLKPQYECNKCKDTGRINGEDCECFKKALSEKLIGQSGLNIKTLPDFDNMCYDIVKNPSHKASYVKASEIFKKYIERLKSTEKKLILLSGNVGVGKTHLLKATANEAIKNGYYTIYTTAFDLNKTFLKYHCAKLDEKDDILNGFINCDLLLIDDLGTENILKNVTIEYLYLIINQRLELNKNTIITTNLNMNELKDTYDERITSRLANVRTCITATLLGDDLRIN